MLAWINITPIIYLAVVGAIFLQITMDAYAIDTGFKFCATRTITVGTRADKGKTVSQCKGCDKLRNCTSVFGSVHLTGISFNEQNEHLRKKLRFPHLREITGHLIVTFVSGIPSLSDILPNLAVIHGKVEYLFQGYALVVYQNKGLQHLGLNSLTLIRQGDTRIEFNQKLCYLDRIRWQSLRDDSETNKYELVVNGNSKNCFEKCSEYCTTPSGHGSSGHKYCWGRGRKNCQKLCHSKCGSSGCEDGSQEKCCDKECLGGCSRADSPHGCNACQNFRLLNGSCVPSCPPGLKEVENFICEKQCDKQVYAELNGKCYKECPTGYKKNKTKCIKCADQCGRDCSAPQSPFPPSFKISTLSDSAKLKGCTVADGGVEIEIRKVPGGTNIAKVLSDHLGALEEIRGPLIVRKSSPLISLNFFKNLTKIVTEGHGFSAKDYALAIFDNPNLESLWDFRPDFKIVGSPHSPEKDGVFIQLNPRLCPNNIYPLIDDVLKMNQSDPSVDVSKTTNGNAGTCNVDLVNITIKAKENFCFSPLCVQVSWNKVDNNDYRNVLLYSVWFRETEQTNLNEYDDVDACNADHVWNRQDTKPRRRTRLSMIVKGLKPFTLYAFRLESMVIAGTSIKSSITYFKTKQIKPSVPRNLEVSFLSSSSLRAKWREPFFPNGEITHYVVRYHESQSSYLWNMNTDWCKSAHFPIYFNKEKEENDGETSTSDSCRASNTTCDCDNEKNNVITPDLKEALFAKQFQDEVLNTVFRKDDDKDNDNDRTKPRVRTPKPNVIRNKTTPFSQGCDNKSKNSSCTSFRPEPTSNPTAITSTLLQPTSSSIITLNTTSRTIDLTELKYFTDYSVEVCACNSGAGCGENRRFVTQCSTAIGRTDKNDTADNVGNTLKVNAQNSSRKFTLYWKAPVSPNGAVLRYDVWILISKIEKNETSNDTRTECIPASKTEFLKQDALFGEYRAKVRAITPVGNGSWSNEVSFQITQQIIPPGTHAAKEDMNIGTLIGVSIAAILVAVVFFAVLTYSFIQRHKKNETGAGVIYSSTNPEYWNCAEVYVPDEWEVPRENITLIRELGNGSFGMVWEGEAVGILPGVECCKVAVKTVSDNSSIRDKVEFLKEASIMKAFNCNHVLRLLGVVSAGDPVLVIMELMENGDLKSFLRRRRPDAEEAEEQESPLPPPSDVELYKMAAEIADGMAYLADRKFVHRDLAARNCMVSGSYTCKIGDFGMARDVYETDYYRKGGKGFLPVRWMAPESLKDGVFCSASDVWSYGVVLWEMATLAEQPYQGRSNEEVMKYVLDGNVMDVPEASPPKLTEIMLLCWHYKSKQRPSFLSIVERLEGYLSIDFIERSFYHNDRTQKDTDTSSLVSLGTDNDNLPELPELKTERNGRDPIPRESFV